MDNEVETMLFNIADANKLLGPYTTLKHYAELTQFVLVLENGRCNKGSGFGVLLLRAREREIESMNVLMVHAVSMS